jgi:hypothetical protein
MEGDYPGELADRIAAHLPKRYALGALPANGSPAPGS